MLRNRDHYLTGSLLAAAFLIVASSQGFAAEEYVWARFYGSNPPTGYKTNGFGSYYVPKSMALSKLQTDPIKKPANSKPDDKAPVATKPAETDVESQPPKPAPKTQKSFWKRVTFQ